MTRRRSGRAWLARSSAMDARPRPPTPTPTHRRLPARTHIRRRLRAPSHRRLPAPSHRRLLAHTLTPTPTHCRLWAPSHAARVTTAARCRQSPLISHLRHRLTARQSCPASTNDTGQGRTASGLCSTPEACGRQLGCAKPVAVVQVAWWWPAAEAPAKAVCGAQSTSSFLSSASAPGGLTSTAAPVP